MDLSKHQLIKFSTNQNHLGVIFDQSNQDLEKTRDLLRGRNRSCDDNDNETERKYVYFLSGEKKTKFILSPLMVM